MGTKLGAGREGGGAGVSPVNLPGPGGEGRGASAVTVAGSAVEV